MKVWVEGKPGIEAIKKRLLALGFELDMHNPKIVFVLGGDGSILKAARKYPRGCLLGIRKESAGFLAEIDEKDLEVGLEKIVKRRYLIKEVPQIELVCGDARIWGINEVYFFRNQEGANRFMVYVDGQDVYGGMLFGDGCMLATPYGSKGYNYTVGGIVLNRDEVFFSFTPMATAYMNKRVLCSTGEPVAKLAKPIKVPQDTEVVVRILRKMKNKFAADGMDGERVYRQLRAGDEIIFRKSKKTSRFVILD